MNHDTVAHIIPTHERPRVCQRLIDSIRHFYPDARIYVCDDSRRPHTYPEVTNVPATAYDIGLSAKRNLLVQASTEPYVFVWDDDYICSSHTDLSVFFDLLEALDEVGIVGGERFEDAGHRWEGRNWFCGRLYNRGSVRVQKPPAQRYETAEIEGRTVRYHIVDFTMNWFLADRRALEAVPWDEELKLQEHVEFFARLAAARADTERAREWSDHYARREDGEDHWVVHENGRVRAYTLATFSNKQRLSHLEDNTCHAHRWYLLDKSYAEELAEVGLVASPVEMTKARPFPIPDVPEDVPLRVALTVDSTCLHDPVQPEAYTPMRERDAFFAMKEQKTGTVNDDAQLTQWNDYPYADLPCPQPDPDLLSLPTLNPDRDHVH